MTEQTSKSGENMSQIQSLTDRAQSLSRSQDRWNDAYMVFVALTVLLAALVFVAQYIASRKGKQLAVVQAELILLKDEALGTELKDKDLKIADATKASGEANERAGNANEKAAELYRQAEVLRKQNLETEAKLESERASRLELEESLAPRSLDQSNLESLRPFSGIQVVLEYLVDAEVKQAAGQIRLVLNESKWKIISDRPVLDLDGVTPLSGITVAPYRALRRTNPRLSSDELREIEMAEERPSAAARAIVEFLKDRHWEAHLGWTKRGEIPPNSIKISIDLKPAPYSLSKEEQKALEIRNKQEAEAEARQKNSDRERAERVQEETNRK